MTNHPHRSAYRADTPEAEEICCALGWQFEMRPVKTLRRGAKVFVTGTLLKPEEWRALKHRLPDAMADGAPIVLRGYPL